MPTDKSATGTYVSKCKWGTATLIMHADHTFTETIATASESHNGSGTWHLQPPDSGGNDLHFEGTYFSPTNHDEPPFSSFGDAYIYMQDFMGSVTIVTDPDDTQSMFIKQ